MFHFLKEEIASFASSWVRPWDGKPLSISDRKLPDNSSRDEVIKKRLIIQTGTKLLKIVLKIEINVAILLKVLILKEIIMLMTSV